MRLQTAPSYQVNDNNVYGDEDGTDLTAVQSVRGAQDKRVLKISYLEAENRNLQQMCDDL